MSVSRRAKVILAFSGLIGLVLLTYANHFQNPFHFDDSHSVVDNVYIRDLHNIPLFFKDGRTSSVLPPNRVYRPVVVASLAIDYWLSHGLHPLWFHISTFFWFLALLGLMIPLYRGTLDLIRPDENNLWIALFATALFGVHPAVAETVNYIIQRAELYATLGVVAGFAIYILFPEQRKFGFYLFPVVIGILSKPTAVVFPALLLVWILLFEEERYVPALLRSLPAWIVSGAAGVFVAVMNPSTYTAGALSPWGYRMTQPAVLMSYFRRFFIPLDLTADTDRRVLTSFLTVDGVGGTLFLLALIGLVLWCRKRRELRPIGFGIAWFLISSVPSSLIALSEVENDHRLFMPFVGLALSVVWAAALIVERYRVRAAVLAPACGLLLAVFAWGAHERNEVWSSDETLWKDVTVKSPENGRGLMNYALTLMSKGQTAEALDYYNRALVFSPDYYILEINLGIANTTLGNIDEGERHFRRAIQLAPGDATAHYYYARWLVGANRQAEAIANLDAAIRLNPDYVPARDLLMETYASGGNAVSLKQLAQDTLTRFPGNVNARSWLARADGMKPANTTSSSSQPTADAFVAQSLSLFRAGKYLESIAVAQEALRIKPDYAEAWNNIGAAWNQLGQWDRGIAAEQQALKLKPDLEIARNNLAWATREKQKLPAK